MAILDRTSARTFAGGGFFEKGAVRFSAVSGQYQEELVWQLPLGDGREFCASGVSIVLHPVNP